MREAASANGPLITLNNGVKMPALGLGVYGVSRSAGLVGISSGF
jgi:hypothetical protein